jgi:transposase
MLTGPNPASSEQEFQRSRAVVAPFLTENSQDGSAYDDMRGFVVLPKRWIVERLFAHLIRTRRLARDYERRTTGAEAVIYWSMTLLMTRRLARPDPQPA